MPPAESSLLNPDVNSLSLKLSEVRVCFEKCAEEALKQALSFTEEGLRAKLVSLAHEFSFFSLGGEDSFTCCQKLMDNYTGIIKLILTLRDTIASPSVRSIFVGITDILESRLNYFNDIGHMGQNPVALEKNRHIEEALRRFSKKFNELEYTGLEYDGLNASMLMFTDGLNESGMNKFLEIITDSKEEFFNGLYEVFKSEVMAAAQILDNLDKRPEINFYYDLLRNEFNELSIIVKRQIFEVESVMLSMEPESGEYKAAFRILTAFRETYQYTGNSIGFLNELFETALSKITDDYPLCDFTDFIRIGILTKITASPCADDFNRKLRELKSELESALRSLMSQDLTETSFGHIIYQVKKYVSDNSALTESVKEPFINIINCFDENSALYETLENYDIMKGIYDTLKIKTACLDENKEILEEISLELLDGNKDKILNFYGDEAKPLVDLSVKIWLESGTDSPDFDVITGLAEYTCFLDRRRKQHGALIETIGKKSMAYKKDYLLFEVSTYEEIMSYSVPRLRDSENSETADFAMVCDMAFDEILNSLKRNSIIPIRPEPHDMFNAREHEVMMAEKNADFRKGEIIKLMNSGFKQDDTVIIRANVIAAK